MAGIRFEGTSTALDFGPPHRISAATKGGISSTTTWTLEPEGDATRVTIHSELTMPGKLLGKLAEPLVMRENSKEAGVILTNLKARMEQST